MINRIMATLAICALASVVNAEASKPGNYYVTADSLNVRLAANGEGKITNKLSEGQKVEVLEVKDGWARISQFYSGASEGISGDVARWASARYLSEKQPMSKRIAEGNSPVSSAIKYSDDYLTYENTFLSASENLISDGNCKLSDFKEMGGWMRSSNHKPKAVYFTYCSGKRENDRIYLDADSGQTFR